MKKREYYNRLAEVFDLNRPFFKDYDDNIQNYEAASRLWLRLVLDTAMVLSEHDPHFDRIKFFRATRKRGADQALVDYCFRVSRHDNLIESILSAEEKAQTH